LCKMFLDRQWNADGVKTLIKKTDMTSSIDRPQGVVVHAVRVHLPTLTKLRASHSAKKTNHRQLHRLFLSTTFRRAIFRCKLCVCGLSSWLIARPSTSLMLAGVRALRGRPLPCGRSILLVMSVFLIKVFTPSTFHCLPRNILHKRVAP